MGVLPDENTLSKHDGLSSYGNITAISESPLRKGLLYAGTDDGNLQISRDEGKTWKNVIKNVPGIPERTYVSRIVASHHEEGKAYATFDGHRNDDFDPYVFMTANYGESWKNISNNLQEGGTVNVIREHHRNPNLLFVGTERGAYFSIDRGKRWIKFKNDFPIVPVDDIAIHPRDNDLIFGTHGRSIWILDDITPLEQLTKEVLNSPCYLFDIRTATIYNFFSRRAHYDFKGDFGHKVFRAPNPPYGSIISYYLKEKAKEELKIIIRDSKGQKIRELSGTKKAGINRIIWDLRYDFPASPPPAKPEMNHGPSILPGKYQVTLKAAGQELTKTIQIEGDPKIDISLEERKTQHDTLISIYKLNPGISAVSESSDSIKKDIKELKENLKKIPDIPDVINQQIESIAKEIDNIRSKLLGDPELNQGRRFSTRGQLNRISRSIEGYTEAPSERQLQQIKTKSEELKVLIEKIKKIIEIDIPKLNKLLNENNIPRLFPEKITKR